MTRRKPDYILLITLTIIIFIGLAALFSASVVESQKDFGDIYAYFYHQLIWGLGFGLALAFLVYKIPYRKWRMFALPILLTAIFSLLLVFIPSLSSEAGGARRWINLSGFSFQPAELAKLGSIIYLAAWFEGRQAVNKRWSEGFVPFLIVVGVLSVLIILQPDVGTLGVIALTAMFMYFLAGASLAQVATIIFFGAGLLFVLVKTAPYRAERIMAFFNISVDPLGISYQINQALLAIGSGGLLGLGLGKGIQKYSFLPEPMKDSIFAVWSEEMGFIGGVVLIVAFLLLGFCGLRIARKAPDKFGRYLAAGIVFCIMSQAFINIGSMLGLIPLTGIPLPLVSYGGSSMVVTLMGMAMLLNISKYT